MGSALDDDVALYKELLGKGQNCVNEQLYNGEYFYQMVQWKNLRAKNPAALKNIDTRYSQETKDERIHYGLQFRF